MSVTVTFVMGPTIMIAVVDAIEVVSVIVIVSVNVYCIQCETRDYERDYLSLRV